jgi:hypothetical protein
MEQDQQILDELHKLITDVTNETAYQKIQLLSPASQNMYFQLQTNLVNAHHIWGDALRTADPAVRKLSGSIAVKNLQTFVDAAAAVRELYLILPTHLIEYQNRAEKVIQLLNVQISGQ